jgi:two-component system, cell cycle sensor histidine kinase DivJ
VRKFLIYISNLMSGWRAHVDGMIHPQAATDPFLSPLHRSFLVFCFVSGTAALLVLPLHLALAGPPQVAMILVLAWMLSQWPLALYLSQSGNLDRSIGLSASMCACFISAICFLTGGMASFALPWLLIPPVEAAFSTQRKTAVLVTVLCAVLLASIAVIQPRLPEFAALALEVRLIATLAALIYVGVMAQRVSLDRRRARYAVQNSELKRQLMSQSVSEIFCELDTEGNLQVVGGPAADLFGAMPSSIGDDWLFQRLHVADRPLYLTKLSDVRNGGAISTFEVRMRIGASVPGERGHAEFRQLEMQLRSIQAAVSSSEASNDKILLKIRVLAGSEIRSTDGSLSSGFVARTDRISGSIIENANTEAREAFSKINLQAERLGKFAETNDFTSIRETARQIDDASKSGTVLLKTVAEFVPGAEDLQEQDYASVDVGISLRQSLKLVSQAASQHEVEIDVGSIGDLPPVLSDEKLLHKALCYILHELVETSGNRAVVDISGNAEQSFVEVTFSVSNRASSLSWNSADSRPVLDFANRLLEKSGASVSVQTLLGHGDNIVLRLPRRTQRAACSSSASVLADIRPIAKTA